MPAEPIEFPPVDAALIEWAPPALAERGLPGWRVADQLDGAGSIAIYLGGGSQRNLVTDTPTVFVEVSADTVDESASVAQKLRALIKSLAGEIVGGVTVLDVGEFAGPASLPVADHPNRYVFTLSIDIRSISD